jgi:5-methylcytosine-specific restriction protein A
MGSARVAGYPAKHLRGVGVVIILRCMGDRSYRRCAHAGCQTLVLRGRCEAHKGLGANYEQERPNAYARGYDRQWQRAREGFLRQHPLCECEDCQGGKLRVTPANVVDHIVPHKGDKGLFWDESNWQAMGKSCHDRKTRADEKERTQQRLW